MNSTITTSASGRSDHLDPSQDSLDLALILHSHSSDLVNISHWLESVSTFMGVDPFIDDDEVSPESATQALEGPMGELLQALLQTQVTIATNESDHFSAAAVSAVNEAAIFLEKYISSDSTVRAHPPYVYSQVLRLRRELPPIKKAGIAHSIMRRLYAAIHESHRILCWYDMRSTISMIQGMEYQTHTLREYLLREMRTFAPFQPVPITFLVRQAVRERGGFAERKQIELEIQREVDAKVYVQKSDMLRALGHLLNNAIKYNFGSRNFRVWVGVRSFRRSGNVCVEIENWGVPITEDEIKSRRLFRIGRRGTYAPLHVPAGSGIGLSDAERVVRRNNGILTIKSHSSRPQRGREVDYSVPFITTVSLELPELT